MQFLAPPRHGPSLAWVSERLHGLFAAGPAAADGLDPAERYARLYLAEHRPAGRADALRALRAWIARRERSAGGGANDLFAWDDGLWQDQAERVLCRVEADPDVRCTWAPAPTLQGPAAPSPR